MAPSLNMHPNRPGPSRSIGDDYKRLPQQQPPTPTMPRYAAPQQGEYALPREQLHYAHYQHTPSPLQAAHPPHHHLGSAPLLTPPRASYTTPPPTQGYAHGRTPPSLPPYALPPIATAVGVPALPALPPAGAGPSNGPDLSQISRGPLGLPDEEPDFAMSAELRQALRRAGPAGAPALHARVIKEAAAYADDRKGVVRDALKRKQHNANVLLSPIDKGKLRSRREAKVHRVKERCFEKALKDAIRWFIDERAATQPMPQTPAPVQTPVQPRDAQSSHPQQQVYPEETMPRTNHNCRP